MKIDEKELRITSGPKRGKGGQHVGGVNADVTVELPGCISITSGIHQSQLKNKELAIALIELAMDER